MMSREPGPNADEIDGEPMNPKGASKFRTHDLVSPHAQRLEFRMTTFNKLFLYLVPAVGVIAIIVAIPAWFAVGWYALFAVGAGVLFLGFGGWQLRRSSHEIIFDKNSNKFISGDEETSFSSVHALQLLSQFVKQPGPEQRSEATMLRTFQCATLSWR